MTERAKGLVHIYTGNGKGKTTCSVGLSVRAAGNGKKVLFIQFMKTGKSSEISVLEHVPGIEVMDAPRMKKFSFNMNEDEIAEMKKANHDTLEKIKEKVMPGERSDDGVTSGTPYDLLVMDECLGALHKGFLDEEKLIAFIDDKPEDLELVMTGRHPDDLLLERADYVSEIRKVKHPYDEGVMGRKGIEF